MTAKAASNKASDRRDRKRLRSEELILDAATNVFLSKGMSSTTMQDIAQGADVAPGTLYYYFPNKESLTVAVVRRMLKEHGRQVLEMANARGDLSPLDIAALATLLLIKRGITDPFWRALVERYDMFVDTLHDELEEFAMLNMKRARTLDQLHGTDELLADYWRVGAWVISGAIRDIALGRVGPNRMYNYAMLVLRELGTDQAQARAIIKRVRSSVKLEEFDGGLVKGDGQSSRGL